jgi:uncharacterized protein (DUF58 family)
VSDPGSTATRLRITRQGVSVCVAGVAALVVGRVFGIVELYVIGAACFAAVAVAVAAVWTRRPRIEASRWIHPSLLVAGDTGRVDIAIEHTGRVSSAPFVLEEAVQRTNTEDHVARLPMSALRAGSSSTSGYRVPTAARGVIQLGPLRAVTTDVLGLARSSKPVVGIDEIVVAPRTEVLDMPELGRGAVGEALLASSRRLGPGDFHGLREYATGDEPRSIHWRASARTDELMVREHTVEGLHQCTVVFDPSLEAHGGTANFERGVTAAASLVHSAARAGLNTRFITGGGIDLRGPEVVANTLRVLARIEAGGPTALPPMDADMVDGLVLLVVITGTRHASAWQLAQAISNPTITRLIVTTNDAAPTRLAVAARSEDEFVGAWQAVVGRSTAVKPHQESAVPAEPAAEPTPEPAAEPVAR